MNPTGAFCGLHTDEAAFERIAEYFKVLGEPLRLRLLAALYDGEKNVCELMAATGANQANVSKHLRVMLDAGVLARRKAGTSAYYRINEPMVFALCDAVCDRCATTAESGPFTKLQA